MKKTTIVNLFAGPGAGKTTLAPVLFSELNIHKPCGETVFVQEFAKQLIYRGEHEILAHQPTVTEGQIALLEPFIDYVDLIVTDSPVLLGLVYGKEEHLDEVFAMINRVNSRVNTVNIFLERMDGDERSYDPRGREQNFEEAKIKDGEIKKVLDALRIPYISIKNSYDIKAVIKHMVEEVVLQQQNSIFRTRGDETHPHWGLLKR